MEEPHLNATSIVHSSFLPLESATASSVKGGLHDRTGRDPPVRLHSSGQGYWSPVLAFPFVTLVPQL
jgi:hypothetical protein